MAAVPKSLSFSCPACGELLYILMKLGNPEQQDGRLVADLSLDTAPLRDHLADVHGLTPGAPPIAATAGPAAGHEAKDAATGEITVHVHVAPPPESFSAALRTAGALKNQELQRRPLGGF